MNRRTWFISLSLLLGSLLGSLLLSIAPLRAQPLTNPTGGDTNGGGAPGGIPGTDRQMLDGVAAVVGNEVVLMSDVMQQAALYARQNRGLNAQDPKLQHDVLNAIIDEKLVLTRAREDSIVVSEDEISRAVDYQVQRILSQFGNSVEKVEQAYGMSMDRIRRESREIIRQQFMVERERQKRFADLKPTEHDMQEFYQLYKDSIPTVPEQVDLASIVLLAKPSPEAKAATVALARRIIDSIKAGGDFADFARRYSADPGSASSGGDNGFVKKGSFVAEYENAAAKLGINEISEPVESVYGIHIIQVLDRHGDETRSRHILLTIGQSPQDRDSMIARLNALRTRALNGENFSDLAKKYSEDEETKGLGGSLGKLTLDQIPADAKDRISNMKDGDITEPIPVMISPTESGYQIVKLVSRIPAHPLDPQNDRAQLERLATLYKQSNEYSKWIAELRTEIYWEIKTNF
jgi:peptidyl-prolyl cis-trans isomerase SurA